MFTSISRSLSKVKIRKGFGGKGSVSNRSLLECHPSNTESMFTSISRSLSKVKIRKGFGGKGSVSNRSLLECHRSNTESMVTSISRRFSKVKIRKGFGGKGSVYIVYMGARQHEDPNLVTASHYDMLASVLGSKEAAVESMLYSYKHCFSGFSATLTESQAKQISKIPGVIRVTPSRTCTLETTRSCLDYSHPTEILSKTNRGDGVIIGVVDSDNAGINEDANGTDLEADPTGLGEDYDDEEPHQGATEFYRLN